MLPIRIGTRGSALALAQTEAVRGQVVARHPELAGEDTVEVVVIKTTGDVVLDRPLAEIGGKGLFTKEIDAALLEQRIDIAVHSVKDLPTRLPAGIDLAATLPREDPRDVLIAAAATTIAGIPAGAVVGTASLRRQAQILSRRPDLEVVPLRGNVQTRLARVESGAIGATLLALAGLRRLQMPLGGAAPLSAAEMLPAVGQGAIGVTCRSGDDRMHGLLAELDHAETSLRIRAERAMLDVLDGSCRTPIAGLAECQDGRMTLRGLVARPDGSRVVETVVDGLSAAASEIGRAAGEDLLRQAGEGFLHIPG